MDGTICSCRLRPSADGCQAENHPGRKDAHRKPPRLPGAALDG
jgi:hypothetical protein